MEKHQLDMAAVITACDPVWKASAARRFVRQDSDLEARNAVFYYGIEGRAVAPIDNIARQVPQKINDATPNEAIERVGCFWADPAQTGNVLEQGGECVGSDVSLLMFLNSL